MEYILNLEDFKIREEGNDTITCLSIKTHEIFYLNATAKLVLFNKNISNSKDLLKLYKSTYPMIEDEKLESDLNKLLCLLDILEIISLKNNPEYGKDGIFAIGETDYTKFSLFVKNSFNDINKLCYGVVGIEDYYAPTNLRSRQFNNSEISFIKVENQVITAGVTLSYSPIFEMMSLIGVFVEKENAKSTLNTLILDGLKIIGNNCNKIRFSFYNDSPLIKVLNEIGFIEEAVLKKEFNGNDLTLLSLFMDR